MYDDPQRLPQRCRCFNCSRRRSKISGTAPNTSPHNWRRPKDVAAAEAIATRADSASPARSSWRLPSYGVALTPADGDVGALDTRLRSGIVPVIGRREGERLVLDLRSVFAGDRIQRIVELVAGGEMPANRRGIVTTDRGA